MNKALKVFKLDYYRNTGGKTYKFYRYFSMSHCLKSIYWMRKAQNSSSIRRLIARVFFFKHSKHNNNDYSWRTKIGEGIYFGHVGGRYINPSTVIGRNCNINQNVTIGQENRGKRLGVPVIGDKVWFGAGCVVVGKIKIGNNVLIAPNTFVNFDVPDNSIVIGNPGKIINRMNATNSYINHII